MLALSITRSRKEVVDDSLLKLALQLHTAVLLSFGIWKKRLAMDERVNRIIGVVLLILLGVLVVVVMFGQQYITAFKESREKPDRFRMRSYLVSKMTDAELIKLHTEAVQDFEVHKQKMAEAAMRADADRARQQYEISQRQQECLNNPAIKLRRGGCSEPTYERFSRPDDFGSLQENPEAYFEAKLMGICTYVESVREMRQAGCLPKLD